MEGKRTRYLGALSEVLHIRPWEIDLLELGEFHMLCDYLERRVEAERRAIRDMGGPVPTDEQVVIGPGSDPSDLMR